MYCAGAPDQSYDQPLLVTTNCHSLVRTRRSLYEALLQLEQQGAVVVERALHHVDVALSPSTCLCIWTEQAMLQASNMLSCTTLLRFLFWCCYLSLASQPSCTLLHCIKAL